MPPMPSSALLPMEHGSFRMSTVHIHVHTVVNLLQEVIDVILGIGWRNTGDYPPQDPLPHPDDQ